MGRKHNAAMIEGNAADQVNHVDGEAPPAPESNGTATAAAETKADRFARLANQRVPKALKAISRIANLGSKAQYEYTEEQAAKICDALSDAVSAVDNALRGKTAAATSWKL